MPALDSSTAQLLLWALIGYGLGSIPFGMVLARVMGLGNLREIGSGNIGATNVLRTGNKTAAALTVLLDGGKGAVAVLLARAFGAGGDAMQLAALAAFLGHCYPVWIGFRGGKGLATFLGIWLALAWPVSLACCATWAVTAAVGRISSLAALATAASSTVWIMVFGGGPTFILGAVLTILVFWRHRSNIMRLQAGTEPRIGAK
jgi:glycerol-3-phosphate acyltransferase PlsY